MTAPVQEHRPRLLLVDDDRDVLNRLCHLLNNQPYELATATDGDQALALFNKLPFDLVLADAHMHGMDGPTLLTHIHKQRPDTIRILLTAHPDLNMLVTALNEGHIYHFVHKPWDDNELLLTLRQAVAHQAIERERLYLLDTVQQRNEALNELNTSLEQRIAARTAELQQTADMLDLAYEELRHSYVVSTEVFSLLINQRLPKEKQTNQQVISLTRAFCNHLKLGDGQTQDITMAAALYNIGKLSWPDNLIEIPSDALYKNNRELFRDYPGRSESLFMALEPLQDARALIRHHQERWDGKGFPDSLREAAIPFGSRLIKLIIDFVELQKGLILERHLSQDEALLLMRKYSGKVYDPDLIEPFVALCTDACGGDASMLAMNTRQLTPDMVMARSLNADSGLLLLNEGKVLTKLIIERLIAFETMEAANYTLFIKAPEASGRSD